MSSTQQDSSQQKQTVRNVYQELAAEYDARIPGVTNADKRFTDGEMAFVTSKITAADEVLDMGCGTGRFTLPLAKLAKKVTGLDASAAMIEQARLKAEQQGLTIEFYEADMERLPFEDQSFDVVVSMLALMHIPLESRQQVFLEASRVLRPGGRLLVSVKNSLFERLSPVDRFASVDITDIEAKELVFTNTQSGNELRAPWYSFSPQDLTRLSALAGLMMVDLKGNIPISAWIDDAILADPVTNALLGKFEQALGDVPPFNYLGYHIMSESVKPLRS